MDIFINDIVYIYEYKNRNNIQNFEDLTEIKVTDISPTGDNIVSGYNIENGHFVETSNGNYEKTAGIVVFKKEKNIITNVKNNKKYFITYNNEIKKYDEQDLFEIYIVTKLDNDVIIKFSLNNFCFDNMEDINNCINKIKLSHFELLDTHINFMLNKQKIECYQYEVYFKENIITTNNKEKLFNYACKNKNSINKTSFDFNKVFSLKFVEYEISKIVDKNINM